MESKRLIKKTGLYFIGNLSSKILSFLLVPIYAFYIKTADLGYYDYAQTVMNVAVPIVFCAIWEAILKYILQEDSEEEKNKVLATSCGFSLFMSIILIIGSYVYNSFLTTKIEALNYIVFMIISYSLMFIWQYYSRALGANRIYVLTGIIGTVVNFGLNILLICGLKMGLNALFISYIMGNLSIIVILEIRLKILKKLRAKYFDLAILKKMLIFSTPLVLNLISTWLITGFGRFIITERLGSGENGLYAFANKFALVISMLGSVINMAIIEEALISAKKEGIGEGFIKTIENLFRIFQSIMLPAVPAIAIFYYIIKATEYYKSIIYFPTLLLYSLVMIMTTSFGTVFQIINKTKYQFITTALGSLVTVVVAVLFIDTYKLQAVVFAQLLGSVVMLMSRYIFVNKYVKFKIKWTPIIFMLMLYCALSVLCLIMPIWFSFVALILATVFIAFLNRDFIAYAINFVKRKV